MGFREHNVNGNEACILHALNQVCLKQNSYPIANAKSPMNQYINPNPWNAQIEIISQLIPFDPDTMLYRSVLRVEDTIRGLSQLPSVP